MIKLFVSVCIEAPAEIVWARLAKLEDIQLWSEPVLQARCEGPLSQGVGAERICELAANQWSVHSHGEKSLLTSEAELEIKGGVLGKMLEPIMGPVMRRMARNALAPFKYFVEHGHPYDGKASELPSAPATC